MKRQLTCVFLFLIIFNSTLKAQVESAQSWRPETVSMGLGLGLDYGVFGANLIVYPQKNIGLFFGGGYAQAGFGYNAGVKLRIQHEGSPVDPFFLAMYGANAIVYEPSQNSLNKIFYGPSFGIGIDLHKRRRSLGYWSFAFILPLRNTEVKSWPRQPANSIFYPFDISVGYKFIIH